MPEKDEGLVLTKDKQKEYLHLHKYQIGDRMTGLHTIEEADWDIEGLLQAQLAKATPIIEKQQQEKDTAYYAEMMKEAIDRVRTETKKQERGRIREDILGGKPVGLTNDKGDMIFPTGYDIPANSFIYFVSQEGLQALKGE